MRFTGFWFTILIATQTQAGIEVFAAKVTKVLDGNTIEVFSSDNQLQKLVLAGIDSPEPGQPFSEKAKKLLEKLIMDKEVNVLIEGKNRVGDYLAVVIIVQNGLDPRIELLEEGLAWTAEKKPISFLETFRIKAQEKKKGIWKDPDPTPPWIYRRQQSMVQAKSS